jgi:6-phosphofructokinase 2
MNTEVVTITLNPSIDIHTSVPGLKQDRKMHCASPKMEPGGGGINVARVITQLGGNAVAIYPAGGINGELFSDLLNKEGIRNVRIKTYNSVRENMMVTDTVNNAQYQFIMPGGDLFETEWQQLIAALEKTEKEAAFWVASGSLPPGVPVNIYAVIADIAKRKNIRLIVDTSGDALKELADRGSIYLLKPNIGELSKLAGVDELDFKGAVRTAREMITGGCCKIMVISMGAAGALLITKDIIYKATPPVMKRKNTVGAGDSMVGGMVYALVSGKSLSESLEYGVACGSAATLHAGTAICSLQDVEKLLHGMQPPQPSKQLNSLLFNVP